MSFAIRFRLLDCPTLFCRSGRAWHHYNINWRHDRHNQYVSTVNMILRYRTVVDCIINSIFYHKRSDNATHIVWEGVSSNWHDVMMNVGLHKKVPTHHLALSNHPTFILIVPQTTEEFSRIGIHYLPFFEKSMSSNDSTVRTWSNRSSRWTRSSIPLISFRTVSEMSANR